MTVVEGIQISKKLRKFGRLSRLVFDLMEVEGSDKNTVVASTAYDTSLRWINDFENETIKQIKDPKKLLNYACLTLALREYILNKYEETLGRSKR